MSELEEEYKTFVNLLSSLQHPDNPTRKVAENQFNVLKETNCKMLVLILSRVINGK